MAPLALAGAIVAVLVVASADSGKSSNSATNGRTVTSSSTTPAHTHTTTHHHGRVYIVKAGDVLSGIAAKTGVALTVLTRLNPKVDAQSLFPGQRLKLAP